MGARPSRQSSQRLIVEGLDDQYVTEAMLRRADMDVTFTAEPRRSVGALIKAMAADVKAPGRTEIGFVIDANSDPRSRWTEIVRIFPPQYSLPRRPCREGTILIAERMPRAGIWMMPDNGSPGELEDFVTKMAPSGDTVWRRAEAYIASLPEDARRHSRARPARSRAGSGENS